MIVLDTHIVIWLLGTPERLSKKAKSAIQEMQTRSEMASISCVSLYEIARGIERNRLRVHSPVVTFLETIETRFHVIPLTARIGKVAAELSPDFPGDPFDRIISASAIVHAAPLVTADGSIRRSREVETIW